MNRHQKPARPFARCPAYRQAIGKLEEALEKNAPSDNAEQLDLIAGHLFGDLWRNRPQNDTGDLPQ